MRLMWNMQLRPVVINSCAHLVLRHIGQLEDVQNVGVLQVKQKGSLQRVACTWTPMWSSTLTAPC